MNIRLATPEDKQQWDAYVENHQEAIPYQRFAWLLSVEQAYQHSSAGLIAFNQDKVVGVLPCVKMQRPFSKPQYCSLPFCDLGFALADNNEIKHALTDHALTQLATEGGSSFEYRDTEQSSFSKELTGKKVRMILALPDTSEALMKGFKSKLRSQVRKAEKNGLTFSIAKTQQHIDDFYQIFSINMRKLGSPVHSKKWFECLFENYQDNISLSVVYTGDTAIGAGIVLRNANKMCIPWASTVAEYNRLAPNMMLYWSLLAHACDTGCSEFDFGRSTFEEGTYKFKRQWGAEAIPLEWSNLLAPQEHENTEASSEAGQLRAMVESIWTKLPLGLTTTLGPKIRKHISL